jgi:D-arabinose 1-dehydrogenase-like Zn-dependent alcohol dehydrogenase
MSAKTTQFSTELCGQYKAKAYAADDAKSPLSPTLIPRRDPGENDVQIEILFCGICHTDLHIVRNEWSAVRTVYPCVPGHEIVGRVTKVGSGVTKFKPGDLAAPLLCAGITTYSPMRHWGVTQSKKVGVVGLGGLGHMAVKFGHAFGAHVVVFTTSPNKKEDALRLGADEVVISRNTDEMNKHVNSFDFILDAVSAEHDINSYLRLLRQDGNMTLVGKPDKPLAVAAVSLTFNRRSLSGSNIGGIAETQEMLDFCGKNNITADVEVIPIQKVNEAYDRLSHVDIKYRFSIDMTSLKSQ